MKTFDIKYEFLERQIFEREFKKFNKKGDLFYTESTFGKITLNFNPTLFEEKFKENDKIFIKNTEYGVFGVTDWIWDWVLFFSLRIYELHVGKKIKFNSLDNPLTIEIEKQGSKVKIYISGYTKSTITTEYDIFLNKIHKFADSFIKDVLKINPKLVDHDQFKQIMEGRDKIKKMLEEAKNE